MPEGGWLVSGGGSGPSDPLGAVHFGQPTVSPALESEIFLRKLAGFAGTRRGLSLGCEWRGDVVWMKWMGLAAAAAMGFNSQRTHGCAFSALAPWEGC